MNLRPRHLVGLILLLTALRGAEGSVLPAGQYQLESRYGIVLQQDRSGVWSQVASADDATHTSSGGFTFIAALHLRKPLATALPTASLATFRTPWTMRPPAAHCVALHAVTAAAA